MDSLPIVHSHPRSGTHLLAASIQRNFYPHLEASGQAGTGHWASRIRIDSQPYFKLLGPDTHSFYRPEFTGDGRKHIYIYRDGRDVAVSLWRAKRLQHPDWRGLSFSEFLRKPLDWAGSPGHRIRVPVLTIAEHWRDHLLSWEGRPGVHYVCYGILVLHPINQLFQTRTFLGISKPEQIEPVRELVGVSPHQGHIGGWRDVFSKDDLAYFHQHIPWDFWGLYDLGGNDEKA